MYVIIIFLNLKLFFSLQPENSIVLSHDKVLSETV